MRGGDSFFLCLKADRWGTTPNVKNRTLVAWFVADRRVCPEEQSVPDKRRHDALTTMSISIIAFVVADLSHEALGHGVAARVQGAKLIVLSYTYLTSDLQTRLISSSGPLVNLVEGLFALTILRRIRMRATASFFVFLLTIYNLLDAAAYLIYSGVLNSGDLGVVIAGLPHIGFIRAGMVVVGLLLYAALTLIGARELRRFDPVRSSLTTPAYLAAIALNCAAAVGNPLGLKYFLISALPTTAGANAGLLAMPVLAERQPGRCHEQLRVARSYPWVVAAVIVASIFIFLIGPAFISSASLSMRPQPR